MRGDGGALWLFFPLTLNSAHGNCFGNSSSGTGCPALAVRVTSCQPLAPTNLMAEVLWGAPALPTCLRREEVERGHGAPAGPRTAKVFSPNSLLSLDTFRKC